MTVRVLLASACGSGPHRLTMVPSANAKASAGAIARPAASEVAK